jgi:hypothetical protein
MRQNVVLVKLTLNKRGFPAAGKQKPSTAKISLAALWRTVGMTSSAKCRVVEYAGYDATDLLDRVGQRP